MKFGDSPRLSSYAQTTIALAGHSNMQTTKKYDASVTADQIELARQASTMAIELHEDSAD